MEIYIFESLYRVSFSDREYQCLGQWEENGQLLAYVRRKDKNNLECFVGATDEFGQIHLSESGSNCQRNLKVIQSGMRLSKAGEFFNLK